MIDTKHKPVLITKIISRYQKSISNCCLTSQLADRTYIYDNSRDGKDAMLLFRLKKGKLVKKYINTLPEWAYPIYNVDF